MKTSQFGLLCFHENTAHIQQAVFERHPKLSSRSLREFCESRDSEIYIVWSGIVATAVSVYCERGVTHEAVTFRGYLTGGQAHAGAARKGGVVVDFWQFHAIF